MHDLIESLVHSPGRYGRRRLVRIKADVSLVRGASLRSLCDRHPSMPPSSQGATSAMNDGKSTAAVPTTSLEEGPN